MTEALGERKSKDDRACCQQDTYLVTETKSVLGRVTVNWELEPGGYGRRGSDL